MRKAARLLRARDLEYARLMAVEIGKPVRAVIPEIHRGALAVNSMPRMHKRCLALEPVDTEYRKSFIAFQPLGGHLGSCLGTSVWQAFRFLGADAHGGQWGRARHLRGMLPWLRPGHRKDFQ